MITHNVIEVDGLKYKAIKPIDNKCSACDFNNTVADCRGIELPVGCTASSRPDNEYVNYKLITEKENIMASGNIDDVKEEIGELATFLDDGYFGTDIVTVKQVNLLIELVVMKMKAIAKE